MHIPTVVDATSIIFRDKMECTVGRVREGRGREGEKKKELRIRMPYSQSLIKGSRLKCVK